MFIGQNFQVRHRKDIPRGPRRTPPLAKQAAKTRQKIAHRGDQVRIAHLIHPRSKTFSEIWTRRTLHGSKLNFRKNAGKAPRGRLVSRHKSEI